MEITEKLVDRLYDTLAMVAISALGGVPCNEKGRIIPFEPEIEKRIEEYAHTTTLALLKELEEKMNEKWNIV